MKIPLQAPLVVCSTAGLLLGILIGRGTAPSEPTISPQVSDISLSAAGRRNTRADSVLRPQGIEEKSSAAHQFEPVQGESGAVARIQLALRSPNQLNTLLRVLGATSQLRQEEIPEVIAMAERHEGEERELLLVGAVARWAELDPKSAAEWTKEQGRQGRSERQMFEVALAEWATREPGAAKTWIEGLESKEHREAALRGYYGGLAARDPAAAFREISALTGDRNRETYEAVFRAWAHKDAYAAGAQVALLTDPAARKTASKEVARIWGATAPREAMNWVLQLPDKELQQDVARDILTRWAIREPQEAMAHLLTLPVELRDEATPSLIEAVAGKNFDDARRFAEQLPAGNAREEALSKIAERWAARDPAAAADYARTLAPGKSRDAALGSIARFWANKEPVAAAQWIAQLPAGDGRVKATAVLVNGWARKDPKAAATWLERQPAGAGRDAGAAAFAMEVRNVDPAAAMDWAAVVEDTKQRDRVVREVLEAWQRKDRAAAKTWLESTPLIDEALRSVLLRTP